MNSRILLVFLALLSIPANADNTQPCQAIVAACEAAGYLASSRDLNSRGPRIDCMRKVLAGTKVEGITISTEEVAACRAKKSKHKKRLEPSPHYSN